MGWETFAKSKGIQKKKRGRMLYDDVAKEWKPRYGYKKAGSDKEQNWVVEVPENGDPYKDWLGEKEDNKKEKVAKNEHQRLQNISKQVKLKSEAINQTVKQAHKSTASLGKFQETSKDEKKAKAKGKHQKFAPVSGDTSSEKEKSLALINKIAHSTVTVNKEKAGNKELELPSRGVGRLRGRTGLARGGVRWESRRRPNILIRRRGRYLGLEKRRRRDELCSQFFIVTGNVLKRCC